MTLRIQISEIQCSFGSGCERGCERSRIGPGRIGIKSPTEKATGPRTEQSSNQAIISVQGGMRKQFGWVVE